MPVYNKLVRDLIPEIIREDGCVPSTRKLNKKEYKEELLKKLVEEAKEVKETGGSKEELTKELGDVQEVLLAIYSAFGVHSSEVNKVRNKRKKKRGAFENKIFLEKVK